MIGSNFLLYYKIISKQDCLKAMAHLLEEDIEHLPTKSLTYSKYSYLGKNTMKKKTNRQVTQSQQHYLTQIVTITDNGSILVIHEKTHPNYTEKIDESCLFCSRTLFQRMIQNKSLGKATLVLQAPLVTHGIRWESFIISYTSLPNNLIYFTIQEINANPCFRHNKNPYILFIMPLLRLVLKSETMVKDLNNFYAKQFKKQEVSQQPELVEQVVQQKSQPINFSILFYKWLARQFKANST